jgi:hypothetical protein
MADCETTFVRGENMFSIAKKLLIVGVIGYVAYKGTAIYVYNTMGSAFLQCSSLDEWTALKKRRASNQEVAAAQHKAWSCVKEKQGAIQAFFYPVPEMWLNPPPDSVTYRNIPDA